MSKKHDRLQFECHAWLWNTYPETRYLAHANFNTLSSQDKNAIGTMARLKSIGLVAGVLDYEFYWKGKLYVFDMKVGRDKLSQKQKNFIAKIQEHGGEGFEIRSLEEFQAIIDRVINSKPVIRF